MRLKGFIIAITITSFTFSLTSLTEAQEPAARSIKVSNPYIQATPPVSETTAAYMELSNASDINITLIDVSIPNFRSAELHNHIHEHGLMKMRRADGIEIKAHGSTILKPGGFHIMLISLMKQLSIGEIYRLSLPSMKEAA